MDISNRSIWASLVEFIANLRVQVRAALAVDSALFAFLAVPIARCGADAPRVFATFAELLAVTRRLAALGVVAGGEGQGEQTSREGQRERAKARHGRMSLSGALRLAATPEPEAC